MTNDALPAAGSGPRPHLELARPFPTTRIGAGARFVVEARPEECAALAARMGIAGIHSVTCRFDLQRGPHDTVRAEGLLQARVSQVCVVTLEPFDADLAESFTLSFVPEGQESDDLDLDADDEVTYAGGILELGEATAEQLALALDPFPRKAGATMHEAAEAPDANPFTALSKLLPPH